MSLNPVRIARLPDYLKKYVTSTPIEPSAANNPAEVKKKKKKKIAPVKQLGGVKIVDKDVQVSAVADVEVDTTFDEEKPALVSDLPEEELNEILNSNKLEEPDWMQITRNIALTSQLIPNPKPPQINITMKSTTQPKLKRPDTIEETQSAKRDNIPNNNSQRGRDVDLSPPRRRHDSDDDLSPPRQNRNSDLSPPRRNATDLSPPRRGQNSSASDLTQNIPKKTGLLTPKEIEEQTKRKQAEQIQKFANRDPQLLGKDAETIRRDKATGKKLTAEEIKALEGIYTFTSNQISKKILQKKKKKKNVNGKKKIPLN
jgi:hypothetical protein